MILQEWHINLNNNRVLIVYKELKSCFEFEKYLENVTSRKLRIAFAKMRTCSHSLNIHTGRYTRLDRSLRLCQLCDIAEVEDEFHFIFKCTCYDQLRDRYIKRYYRNRPNMCKLIELFNTQNQSEVYLLCKYITEALKVRNSLIGMSDFWL